MSSVAFAHRGLRSATAAAALLCILALVWPLDARAADGPRFLLAHAPSGVAVHAWPGGPVTATVPGRTPLASTTWLWITDTSRNRQWGRARLPLRPNGRTGWIDLRRLRLVHTTTWVRASLDERRIWLMRGAQPIATWDAGIGAAESPTPTGLYSVTDRVPTGDPYGPFGWYAFGLSGHQPALPPRWAGGDQLAIHGTNDPGSIGQRASAGCLRISADALAELREYLRLGTPVVIMPTRRAAMRRALAASIPRPHAPQPERREVHHRPKPPSPIDVPTVAAEVVAAAPLTRGG